MSLFGIVSPAGRELWEAAFRVQLFAWIVFFILIFVNHARVTRRRTRLGGDRGPSFRAPASMLGLFVESLAVALAWRFRRVDPERAAAGWMLLAIALAAAALLFLGWALRHLGQQWRIKAVVTADHELITSGPYGIVRHPVFASMLWMLAANVLVVSEFWAGWCAVAVYIAGTEIRVRAEDRLLARRFPEAFATYRSRVHAYIPFVR